MTSILNPRCMNGTLKHLIIVSLLFLLIQQEAKAQAKVRKLSTIINHPSLNVHAPFISADANAIIFISDNADDYVLTRSEEHTSELQSRENLVCRLLLEKK